LEGLVYNTLTCAPDGGDDVKTDGDDGESGHNGLLE